MHQDPSSPLKGNMVMAKSDKKQGRGRPKSAVPRRSLNVRFPVALHDALASLASDEERTVTAQLIILVRDQLQRLGRVPPGPAGKSA